MGERRGAYKVLLSKPKGRRPLGRLRRRCEGNIKWIFEKRDGGMDEIDLAQVRYRWRAVVHAVMNLRVP
jgi:hypothetical protein